MYVSVYGRTGREISYAFFLFNFICCNVSGTWQRESGEATRLRLPSEEELETFSTEQLLDHQTNVAKVKDKKKKCRYIYIFLYIYVVF